MLSDVLDITTEEVVSLVGGGGKTTTMLRLAEEFRLKSDRKVIITTTTKIYRSSAIETELIIGADVDTLAAKIGSSESQVVTVASGINEEDKLLGLDADLIDQLQQTISDLSPLFIVEADGAARRDFKIPNDREPILPTSTQLLLPVVGSRIAEKNLTRKNLHHISFLPRITGKFKEGDLITSELIVEILLNRNGYNLFKEEQSCRVIPLINQVNNEIRYNFALEVADQLLEAGLEEVVLTAVEEKEPVVEVVKP